MVTARANGGMPGGVDRDDHECRIRAAARAVDQAVDCLNSAVAEARDAGMPWSAIGRVLGITRQAAHERFSKQKP